MTSRLMEVAAAAELIEAVTGEPRFEVAKRISLAGQFNGLPLYGPAGKPVQWMPGVYRVIEDDEGRRSFGEMPFFRVDIEELIDVFGYHLDTRVAIVAELDDPPPVVQAKVEARGVEKREILAVEWPLPCNAPLMKNLLNERPKWIADACLRVGSQGKGSHFWNPAKLALALVEPGQRRQWPGPSVDKMTRFIAANFPDYADEWAGYIEKIKWVSNTGV